MEQRDEIVEVPEVEIDRDNDPGLNPPEEDVVPLVTSQEEADELAKVVKKGKKDHEPIREALKVWDETSAQ